MPRGEIETKINTILADITDSDIEEIDPHKALFGQCDIDELDILDVFKEIDKEFHTDLCSSDVIDVYFLTIEELYNIVEQAIKE